jgi:hypothetical protein
MKSLQRDRRRILYEIQGYRNVLKCCEGGMLGVAPGWTVFNWVQKGLKLRDNAVNALFERLEELDSCPYEGEGALQID